MKDSQTTTDAEIIRQAFDRHENALAVRGGTAVRDQGIIVACMDERNTWTEEALGLAPHRVFRFASGGGKIGAADFVRLFTGALASLPPTGRRVFLMTHEVVGRPDLGCAAFKNDMAEQERYFKALRRELSARLPGTAIHALSLDTSTLAVRPIETDDGDGEYGDRLRAGIPAGSAAPEVQGHAARGIYVGEAYRAWVTERNTFFHVSAIAPSLSGDLDIALSVILHHSDAVLDEEHPLVLHIDYPSGNGTIGIADAVDKTVDAFLESPELRDLRDRGLLAVIKTSTDVGTWSAQLL